MQYRSGCDKNEIKNKWYMDEQVLRYVNSYPSLFQVCPPLLPCIVLKYMIEKCEKLLLRDLK